MLLELAVLTPRDDSSAYKTVLGVLDFVDDVLRDIPAPVAGRMEVFGFVFCTPKLRPVPAPEKQNPANQHKPTRAQCSQSVTKCVASTRFPG